MASLFLQSYANGLLPVALYLAQTSEWYLSFNLTFGHKAKNVSQNVYVGYLYPHPLHTAMSHYFAMYPAEAILRMANNKMS